MKGSGDAHRIRRQELREAQAADGGARASPDPADVAARETASRGVIASCSAKPSRPAGAASCGCEADAARNCEQMGHWPPWRGCPSCGSAVLQISTRLGHSAARSACTACRLQPALQAASAKNAMASADLFLRAGVLIFLKLTPEYLSRGGLRKLVYEFDDARHLEGGHALVRPGRDVLALDPPARGRLEHHHRLHGFAAVGVERTDDARLLNVRMRVQHRLDLGRPDLEARGVDHALQAVGDEEVAFLVVVAEISGAEEALAVVLDEGLGGRLFLAPVALEHLRAVDH